MAAQAAATESEAEAEAFAGVAAYAALAPRDRRDLERMLPALLRGAAVVTRLLHGNRRSRQAVRLVPGIVDGAARTILRRAAAGQPVGLVELGRALGAATNRVLGAGPARQAVMRRHARGLAHARRRPRPTRRRTLPPLRSAPLPARLRSVRAQDPLRRPARPYDHPSAARALGHRPRGCGSRGRGRAWSGLSRRFACRPAVAARAGRSAWSATCGCLRGAVPTGRPVSVGGRPGTR